MVREHIKYNTHHCKGELVFSHNQRDEHGHNHTMYKCSKCGDIINLITCPSYEDMKRRGW
jgi:hypothetical protein